MLIGELRFIFVTVRWLWFVGLVELVGSDWWYNLLGLVLRLCVGNSKKAELANNIHVRFSESNKELELLPLGLLAFVSP